jgi:iron complex transport system substrate-binding protein
MYRSIEKIKWFKKLLIFILIIFLFQCNLFAEYKRIISLAPSVTESLYELGMDEQLIANTTFCSDGKIKKEKIGTFTEPNIEKIISLKPDLIIATKEGNNKVVVEKMIRLNLPVYVMETVSDFKDICNNFQQLADFLEKTETANKIISDVKQEINSVYKENEIKTETVFWEVGANPLFTVGKQSYINDYNKFIGIKNVFADIDMRYPNISIEAVIEKNPDIIILVNMGDISTKEIKRWNKYKTINAVKNKKIFMLNANDIFTPTPKTFLKGLKILHSKILEN